jgi:hypothetical protein
VTGVDKHTIKQMRGWLTRVSGEFGWDVRTMTDQDVTGTVARSYRGGIRGFVADHGGKR